MITLANWLRVVLTLLCLHLLHQWRYREQYEKAKDKFTSVLETPEYEAHKRSKKIGDVSFKTNLFLSSGLNVLRF